MNVKDIMTKEPACCVPDDGLQTVAKMMLDNDCGSLPVVDAENTRVPVGVITDRDIVLRSVAEGRNPLDMTSRDVMTEAVVTVTPETTVEDCCAVMEEKQIRRVVVVDAAGACCGIVAQADVAKYAGVRETAEVVQEVSKASG